MWWVITVEMVLFAVAAVAFGLLLHRTSFGRATYAIGNNPTVRRCSRACRVAAP